MQEWIIAVMILLIAFSVTFVLGLVYNLFQVVYRAGRAVGDWGMCKELNDD